MNGYSRVVILGHTGFVGRHLFAYFQKHLNRVSVVGLSTAQVDLTRMEEVERLVPEIDEHTVLIHCAAIQKWIRDDLDAVEQNVRMVTNVLRFLQHRSVRQLVYFSSAAVYGEGETNLQITEHTPLAPSNCYGVAKVTGEHLLRVFAATRPTIRITTLRPSLVYGEDNPDQFYLPAGFVRRALAGEAIRVWGDGEELRDYIHIDDVCALVGKILRTGAVGTFNLSSGGAISYRAVLAMIEGILGGELKIEQIPRTRSKVSLVLSNERLLHACGDHKFVMMRDAMQRIVYAKRELMAVSNRH